MKKSLLTLSVTSLMLLSTQSYACLQNPVPGSLITSNFGLRFHPIHKTWKPHKGTDIRAATYTPVNAANTGKVTFSGYQGSAGNVVVITGNDGVQTKYFHLSKSGVNVGDSVSAGQRIALSGKSGHASYAPHLHFQAATNNGVNIVDPKSLFCSPLPEKSGSGPDREAPGGYTAPAVTAQSGSPTTPVGGGTPLASSMPSLSSFSDMSEMDIMQTEAEKRFLNPEWHQRIAQCDTDYLKAEITGQKAEKRDCDTALLKEAVSISYYENWLQSKKMASLERIEAMTAIMHAQVARDKSIRRLTQAKARLK